MENTEKNLTQNLINLNSSLLDIVQTAVFKDSQSNEGQAGDSTLLANQTTDLEGFNEAVQ